MPVYIGMVSQKGGVTKSTLARLIAREYAVGGWAVKIADLDVSQGTSYDWQARRLEAGITPEIPVERFSSVDAALKATGQYNLVVFDGAPHSTAGTKRIAQVSDVVILPTGPSLDDLKPTVLLAHSLVKEGVDRSKLYFALCRVGDSEAEITEARDYLTQAGYQVLEAAIPEKTAYRRASDAGRALTETPFASLNEKANALAQGIVDAITRHTK